jgi:hypothetical protein
MLSQSNLEIIQKIIIRMEKSTLYPFFWRNRIVASEKRIVLISVIIRCLHYVFYFLYTTLQFHYFTKQNNTKMMSKLWLYVMASIQCMCICLDTNFYFKRKEYAYFFQQILEMDTILKKGKLIIKK